jgi:hypothetical protein
MTTKKEESIKTPQQFTFASLSEYVTNWIKSLQIGGSDIRVPAVIVERRVAKPDPYEIIFPTKHDSPDQPQTGYKLEQYLKSILVEQHLAIKSVCYALIRNSTIWNYQQGSSDDSRSKTLPPTFLFVGPGGVGKIYLAKALAQAQIRPFVYFDMKLFINTPDKFLSDFLSDRDNVTADGQLNVVLKQAPNAVIVLNHLELADAKLFHLLFELWQRGSINKTVTARVLDNKRDKQITQATVSVIDASKAIFICITDVEDAVVKNLISSSIIHQPQPRMHVVHRKKIEDEEDEERPPARQEKKTKNDQLNMMFANGRERRTHDPTPKTLNRSIRHNEDLMNQADEDGFSPLDALDSIVEFRHKIAPILVDHFNKAGNADDARIAKCHDAFVQRFNAIIPFFEFDSKQLKKSILVQLKHFADQCATVSPTNQRQLKLTWGEDVVIWLMKRYRPSLSVQGLLENHVLTLLAACDDLFHNGDHIHLSVSMDDLRLYIQIMNQREDVKLKQNLTALRSKL